MENKEAIEYLLYMKHDVQAGSPVDVAIYTAIEALKETAKKPKRNRDKLLEQSLYDLLIKIQDGIESQNAHEEHPCVLSAIEGNMLMNRCEMYSGKCNQCIQSFLNEEAQ